MIITFDSKKSNKPGRTQISSSDFNTNAIPSPKPSLTSNQPPHFDVKSTSDSTTAFKILDVDPLTKQHTKRSRRGCLTCKIRKKKCDEAKPVCSDCSRLKKECVYIDHDTMDPEYIKQVKTRVELTESALKLRKRKRPGEASDSSSKPAKSAVKKAEYSERGSNPNSPDITNLLNHDFVPDSTSSIDAIRLTNSVLLTSDIRHSDIKPTNGDPETHSRPADPIDITHHVDAIYPRVATQVDSLDEPHSLMKYEEISPVSLDQFLGKLKSVVSPESNPKVEEQHDNQEENHNENHPSPATQLMTLGSPNYSSPDLLSYLRNNNFHIDDALRGLSPAAHWGPVSPGSDFSQLLSVMHAPSPGLSGNVLSDLSTRAHYLYDYYVNVISTAISVAPPSKKATENYYQSVFLPLAQNDKGCMYSILAWACFYLGKPDDIKEGLEYTKMALKHFHSQKSSDKATIINKVSSLLILLGAEICRGDVKNWTRYMDWGSKLLNSIGGINSFRSSKQEFWLISNFAYHDVLSSDNFEKGLHFSSSEYSEVFTNDLSSGILNPLMGIAKEIYWRIGEISSLAFETNKKISNLSNELNDKNVSESPEFDPHQTAFDFTDSNSPESDISNHARINEILLSVKSKATELDKKIDDARPDPQDLFELNDEEFEWQITLLETFKLSAKLYLRQAILKCNPSSLECRILTNDLVKCLDIVLGSPVQASLVFPVFIASIHCVTPHDRSVMTKRIEKFIETYGPWSILRSKEVIERIWKMNPDGDKVVDWHAVLKNLGWNINFA